ncbi:hypothetical protein BFL28_07280 [Sphingomonas turrisvirgatae]|uniref:Core-binding (CB) domain-containing protein n=2 Tax=Sphingomonas turrisvirgatae TaxID=1888892 RepID=A0A1E3LR47_9SPHN|nr:hypothetical protein BFL28_07280 [Sphingomonas turrisvirgatae]
MLSLRTKDRDEAKRLIPRHTIETDGLLDKARARMSQISPQDVVQARSDRAAAYEAAREEHDRVASEIGLREADEKEARREELSDAIAALRNRLRGRTAEMTPEERTVAYLFEEVEFDRDILRDRLASMKVQRAALDGSPAASTEAPASPRAPAAQTSGVMLDGEIVDLWSAERKVAKKGVDTHRAVARWFYERAGRKPVGAITRADVLTFKTKLVQEGQSAANIKMKLSRLRTLLQWASENDYAKENAAAGVSIRDAEAARNRRREFDLASLNRIFASAIYTDGERPTGGRGEASFWLPLLALYTGARMEELGQLRPSDVERVTYPDADGKPQQSWFIHIKEEADDKLKLKNAASERSVPVHPELERLGFIRFVESVRESKADRLFQLRPNVYGRLTAKWGEWFSVHLRGTCKVTDRRMVFHSFRHTFKQYARGAGIVEGVQRQIMGHSPGDVADEYGSGYPAHQVVAGMALYRIPGLTTIEPWTAKDQD